MKKIFMMMVVSMIMVFTTNSVSGANIINDVKAIDNVKTIAKNICVVNKDSVNVFFYTLNMNDKLDKITEYLGLDNEQSDRLYDIQENVERRFIVIKNISDSKTKLKYFNDCMNYWKTSAYFVIVSGDDRKAEVLQYQAYWNMITRTMLNRGIIDPDNSELIVYNKEIAIK